MTILSEESCQKWEVWEKYKKWEWPLRGVAYRREVQAFVTLWYWKAEGGDKKPWIIGGTSSYHAKTNTVDGFTERTTCMLDEIASKTVHKGQGDW